jgi:hypothetical protein
MHILPLVRAICAVQLVLPGLFIQVTAGETVQIMKRHIMRHSYVSRYFIGARGSVVG